MESKENCAPDMRCVQYRVTDGLAEIVLDRPKVNALNVPLIQELGQAFRRVRDDSSVRGALLRAEGKCFSAGLDLKELAVLDRQAVSKFLDVFDDAFRDIFACPKPVAAAVEGHAIAGGLVVALAADFVALAPSGYKIGLTELLVGVPFPRSAFEIVRSALPLRALRNLIYTADLLDPRGAFSLGVGDALDDSPQAAARRWLDKVCSRPVEAFRIAKHQQRSEAYARVERASASEREELLDALGSQEVIEAFVQALKPRRA